MSDTYAGDITPNQAWTFLQENEKAVLIDVRTAAEWAWVGQVDLGALSKSHHCVEWVRFPDGSANEAFVEEVQALVADRTVPVLLLCRSGVRSKYAAIALTACGFETCYNISGGFEGDKNEDQHRGTVNGWKVAGLPWVQG